MNKPGSKRKRARPASPQRPAAAFVAAAAAAALGLASAPAFAAERAIEKQVLIAASVDQAWAAWTTREGIVSFFAPDAKVEPRVGGAFQIYIDPGAPAGSKGADDMRFMALQPNKMISFDWNAPPSLPEARAQRTFVVVRFAAVDERQTLVSLHHSGWGEGGQWDRAYLYLDHAWSAVLGNLKKRFDTGPVDWAPWLQQLRAMREAATAGAPPAAASAAAQATSAAASAPR